MPKPNAADYSEFFGRYITQVAEDDFDDAFKNQSLLIPQFLDAISEKKSMNSYAEGKWTLKELLQHITDTERILSYRALCIARKETVSLPSFDENEYAANSFANARNWQSLVNEFINHRKSVEDLFNSFNKEMLLHKGIANHNTINVLSLGFIIAGHFNHHKRIIEERYLP